MPNEVRSMKYVTILVASLLLISFLPFNQVVAQSTQTSSTVKLNAYTLQITSPSEVMPGDVATFIVQGHPNSYGVYIQSLTAAVYYSDASGVQQSTSAARIGLPPFTRYHRPGFFPSTGAAGGAADSTPDAADAVRRSPIGPASGANRHQDRDRP